jgi:hypothetical protein
MSTLASRLLSYPKSRPFVFGVGLATVKTGGVDYFVQKHVEKKESVSWSRVAVFSTFGFAFLGVWQYALFVKLLPRLCGPASTNFITLPLRQKLKDGPGLRSLFVQNFVENGINNPFLYFPIFYTIQEFLNNDSPNVRNALDRYVANAATDIPAIWSVWVPAQCFNFSFCPLYLRVPFVAMVSLFWTAYVSLTRGALEEERAEMTGA